MSDSFSGKTILFLGSGSRKKEFTLKIAKQLGLKVALVNPSLTWQKKYVDYFIKADTYAHNIVLNRLKTFLKDVKVDAAVTFWEDDVPLLAAVCKAFGFIGSSVETAERARNKFAMREAFQNNGVPCPKFRLIESKDALEKAIGEIGFPAVIKPCWGADSEFVVKVGNEEEARNAYNYVLQNATPKFNPIFKYNNHSFVFEEFIEGIEVNVEGVTQNGNTKIVSISDKMPMRAPYFVEEGDYIPSRFDKEILRRITNVALKAHQAIGIQNSITHTEIKVTPSGPKVIEMAARMGGDYLWDWVKTVWNVDLVESALRIALGVPVELAENQKPATQLAGKYFIPDASGIVLGIRVSDVLENPALHSLKLNKKIGDSVLAPPEGFENIGWIVASGSNEIEADYNLQKLMSRIEINLKKYSSDSSIGQSRRRNPFSAAYFVRKGILSSAKIEKLRMISEEDIKNLHVGILCNLFETKEDDPIETDLMSVGKNIETALQSKGHKTTFFDMNEDPLPFEKIYKSKVDIIFNVCERINDSSLLEPHSSALLDMLKIPYTGSNPQTLATCIDKIRVKKLLAFHEIPTPKWDYVYDIKDEVDEELHYPLIVKPANTDNSIGITNNSVVTNESELKRQLEEVVVKGGRPALIEEYIEGSELDISIMGNDETLRVLPLSMSTFDEMPEGYWHIYPFDAKWKDHPVYKKIKVERPAKIPKRLDALVTELAIDTYNILDCHDYGRVEARVDALGNPYILELNPNPSINDGDCVPGCAELTGMNYADFIEAILENAVRRYKQNPPYYHLRTSTMNY